MVSNHCFDTDRYGRAVRYIGLVANLKASSALTLKCRDIVLVPDERSIVERWKCLLVTNKYGSSNVACGAEYEDVFVFTGHIELKVWSDGVCASLWSRTPTSFQAS